MMPSENFEYTQQLHDLLQQALDKQDDKFIHESLYQLNEADIASILHQFNEKESKYILDLLGKEIHTAVISHLEDDTRTKLLKTYPVDELIEVINPLDSDDAADILNEMPAEQKEEVLAGLDNNIKVLVKDLLTYDSHVAGGLMAKELIKANIDWTVAQCIEVIRQQTKEVDKFYTIYVVDNDEQLLGTLPLYQLIIAYADTPLKSIYSPQPVSVNIHQEENEVLDIMRKYDLETVPVVNIKNQLVGRITIDDAVDRIAERAEEERQMMSGISHDVEEYDSVWRLTQARLPWLLVGIIGGLISVQFLGLFEDDILKVTAIAFFIPLIQATSGNVGIQSSSIIVQSLANPDFVRNRYQSRLLKVFSVAILNGLLLSIIVFMINMLFDVDNGYLFAVVSSTLFIVVLFASLIGTVTPLILDKFGLNPALAAGPFITTINDLLGLGVYLLMVHIML